MKSLPLEFKALLWLAGIASALFAWVLSPFFGAVCWAVFLALVFWPLQLRLLASTRQRRSWAALGTLVVILAMVIVPLGLIAVSVTQEASHLLDRLRAGELQVGVYVQRAVDALPTWARGPLDRLGLSQPALLQQKLLASLGQNGQLLTAQAFMLGQNTLDFLVSFCVMLYVLFFLLRDGDTLATAIARSVPLQREHTRRLLVQFATVVRATVKGNILVALAQGALGALAFWVLDLPGALLWGAVMALLSLLPAVGAALVWLPVAGYFAFTGQLVQAAGLTLWGVLAIGLVDNLLRPMLVGKETHMPDYLILVATLGGLACFGLNGFVIGPVIAAMFLVSWDLLGSARRQISDRPEVGTRPAAAPEGPRADDDGATPRRRRPPRRRAAKPPAPP